MSGAFRPRVPGPPVRRPAGICGGRFVTHSVEQGDVGRAGPPGKGGAVPRTVLPPGHRCSRVRPAVEGCARYQQGPAFYRTGRPGPEATHRQWGRPRPEQAGSRAMRVRAGGIRTPPARAAERATGPRHPVSSAADRSRVPHRKPGSGRSAPGGLAAGRRASMVSWWSAPARGRSAPVIERSSADLPAGAHADPHRDRPRPIRPTAPLPGARLWGGCESTHMRIRGSGGVQISSIFL